MSSTVRIQPALPTVFGEQHAFRELVHALAAGRAVQAGGLWGSSQALCFSAVTGHLPGPWLVVTSTEPEAESFAADLEALGLDSTYLPARETYSSGKARAHADPAGVRARLQLAGRLAGAPEERPRVVVASLLSCLQPLPSGESLGEEFIHLNVGARLDAEATIERLVGAGYARQPLAESPGELSLRGDILDLFPFASEEPLRIELFDDEVESLRLFDPESQRSTESLQRVSVCVASDAGDVEQGRGRRVDELLAASHMLVEVEPLRIADTAEGLRVQSSSHGKALIDWNASREGRPRLELAALPGRDHTLEVRSVQGLAVGVREASKALAEALDRAGDEARAVVLAGNDAELDRMRELFVEDARVDVCLGSLGRGFQLREPALFVVNHRELIGIEGTRRATAGARSGRGIHKARALQSFFELKIGDLVVHAVHGLGRYLGLRRMARGEGEEEHLCIEYQDEVTLFVPASKVDLVQRYIASGSGAAVSLDRIGGKSFSRRKQKVEKAVEDLAAELLEVQARREMRERPAWVRDDGTRALVQEMVREFPYTDTPDQELTDAEIHEDLSGRRPMDRLLCGDVGFGKTEVAIRAAFRVVAGGGQAAVLVPTTVLAAQHYRTFATRLADFPVRVEVLSRYVSPKRAKEVVAAANRGEVDILVGTHRILSKDVELPKLGLLVIDEEQRFGVTHKEHFKKLRSEVDILTLSATPIPRTLHMSMSGLRDISALTTPPPGRQDIETILASSKDKQVIREALLREHNRGGQSFFLHNRVQSIDRVAHELAALVPECTFAVGHGQMGGSALEAVMGSFMRGEVDVLVATTIVENGIDVPLAGTILMDRAGHFGLSELHQLRGRVGRGSHKAYCYLLTDETKPLSDIAQERLKALEELNHLGSGFAISMKDLELRGAGNLLGPEQSGHITAVGYDLYCRLLKSTVDRLQRGGGVDLPDERPEPSEVELELGLAAYLPDTWIPSADARLELLRTLDAIRSDEDAAEALVMLEDRFGRVPAEAVELVSQFRLRQLVAEAGLSRATWRDGAWLIEYRDRALLEATLSAAGAPPELRPQGRGRALLMAPAGLDPAGSRAWLEALLRGDPRAGENGSRLEDPLSRHTMHPRLPLLLALLPALGLPAVGQSATPEDPAEAGWRGLRRVAMIVNEDIVTLRELDRMLKAARGTADTTTPQDNQELLAQVAESAVLERLWIQAGANVGIPASDVELTVDRFLADTRRDLSAQQTSDWMAGRGAADLGELREKTRDELYWTFWVRTARGEAAGGLRASRDRYVRPGQLQEAYQINESSSAPPTAIFQFLALSTAAWGDAETAREALEGMREEILAGGDMGAMVDEYGAALRDSRGITPRMPLSAVDSPTLMAFAESADEGALSDVMPIVGDDGELQGYQVVRIISRTEGQPAPDFEDPELQTSIAQRLIKGWDEARINLSSDELWRTAFIRTPPVLELTPPWVRRSQR